MSTTPPAPTTGLPTPDGIELRTAHLEELIDLRHVVLRAGMPREAAVFPGDDRPDSRHYGAFQNGRAVGCATFHVSQWEGEPAWQLRGMAVAKDWCGRGVGREMLRRVEADLRRASPIRQLWCNARVPASGFYQKLGWVVCSAPFDIPTAGPHVKMTRRLGDEPGSAEEGRG